MTQSSKCTCGSPARANYLVSRVIDAGGEAVELDGYYCTDHVETAIETTVESLKTAGMELLNHSIVRIR